MERATHPHALAIRINIQSLKLIRLQTSLRNLEQDIESFLEEYFTKLSHYLQPFLLETVQKHQVAKEDALQEQCRAVEQLLKQLYRHLAKHYHPDSGVRADTDKMRRVNEAYAQKELGSLLLLTSDMASVTQGSITTSQTDLMHYYELLSNMVLQAEEQLRQLEQSEANHLRRHMLVARLNGRNFIEEIAAKLQNKYRVRAFSV
jgi:hypothetical protein